MVMEHPGSHVVMTADMAAEAVGDIKVEQDTDTLVK